MSASPGEAETGGVLLVEPGGRGGVADYTGCLAAALSRQGLAVTVATADDHLFGAAPGVTIAPIFHYVRGDSAWARRARKARLGPAANGLRYLISLPGLLKLARRHRVVHLQGFEHALLGLVTILLLRAVRTTQVVTLHNTFDRGDGVLSEVALYPRLIPHTIVHTQADLRALDRSATVIPHGHYEGIAGATPEVDPAMARRELGIEEQPVVLAFGHLRPDKGLGDLLAAAAETGDWTVLIAGQDDGGLAGCQEQLLDPRLEGRVIVREGFLPMTMVGRLFAAADLVALPYRQASQSGVLHLAYGFGRPVAVYPVGGLVEAVLDRRTGWICAESNPTALTAVLKEAAGVGRPEMARRGAAGRQWARQEFDWDRIATRTAELYRTAISPGPTGA